MGIDNRGEYIKIPAHPLQSERDRQIFEAAQHAKEQQVSPEELLKAKMDRRKFLGLGVAVAATIATGGVILLAESDKYNKLSQDIGLVKGQVLLYHGMGVWVNKGPLCPLDMRADRETGEKVPWVRIAMWASEDREQPVHRKWVRVDDKELERVKTTTAQPAAEK